MPSTHETEGGGDFARFFANWIRHPVKMGAVAPSSRAYCAMMVRNATTHLDGPILELGPGLGVVTRALLEAGVDPARITSVEYDKDFAATLQKRFPAVNVVQGDGFDLDRTLPHHVGTRYAAILFAIPILNFPQAERQRFFTDYAARLVPGGNITQLSYLWSAPVKPVPGAFGVRASPIVWNNVPPARVWIYDKAGAGA
ncbi:methyltransferase domain-containing protein [Aurantimonas sp. Leaf443]|uniref:class I SAM-dependent methyltransferase n=1 Tax=Aurantimonas sp. Leaf443 TaxID=1736378 RepID=UPI0006F7EB66|nr:methyltransferase domain-containing protein [Aurantimonas sp. Leaf443]KQT85299.1 ribose ABC transporter permease [Aurantimonas sp. Leaf443]